MKAGMMALAGCVSSAASAATWCGSGSASIPDDGQTARAWMATVDLPADHLIVSVAVHLDLSHTWVGDLQVSLVSPAGDVVSILDRPGMPDGGWIGPWGCGGDDVQAIFRDDADAAAEETCTQFDVPVLSGSLRPHASLAMLYGTQAAGDWSVVVRDLSPIDSGSMVAACVTIESSPDCNGNGVPDVDDIEGGGSNDDDGNGVPDECQCPGDVDGSGTVGVDDLLVLIGQFGGPGSGDLDGDGLVDADDLLLMLAAWGDC
ncbi:MAG: proprotein convertase P-domain-containing protein [Phycisphaerales bacterium]|jgi:hypothetical protein|nr:proprotein convertase P-domain-containing protein [Phycisphaerales bacterium]